jgi:AcrR family transcriptional regulator
VTTRRLAREAGLNHGLVHYHFGSVDAVMMAVLDRFAARLIDRQRTVYQSDRPFLEKWRTAVGFVEADLASGTPKVWHELQAMAWSRPSMRARVAAVNTEWRSVLTDAFTSAAAEYRLSPRSVEAIVALVMTFSDGMLSERLIGVDAGHAELLRWIEGWLLALADGAPSDG